MKRFLAHSQKPDRNTYLQLLSNKEDFKPFPNQNHFNLITSLIRI